MYTIEDHVLIGPKVRYVWSPNTTGGTITPKYIVQHFTATMTAESAIKHLSNRAARVSAHLVVDLDGTITQMLKFNVKGWHCGASFWQGHNDLNDVSIGIENVNYGPTPFFKNGLVHPRREGDFNPVKHGDPAGWHKAAHPLEPGREQWWQLFTKEQLAANDEIVALLVDAYNIRQIVGHEEIATPRGRKTDPGPAFPLAFYKEFADFGNSAGGGKYTVVAESLYMRGGPGTSYEILQTLKKGTAVKVLHIDDNNWALIEHDRTRAYVKATFLKRS